MKPASLVTILLRLTAIGLFFYTLMASIAPLVAMVALKPSSIIGLFTPLYFIYTIIPLILASLLYIWSLPLGHLIARDLD